MPERPKAEAILPKTEQETEQNEKIDLRREAAIELMEQYRLAVPEKVVGGAQENKCFDEYLALNKRKWEIYHILVGGNNRLGREETEKLLKEYRDLIDYKQGYLVTLMRSGAYAPQPGIDEKIRGRAMKETVDYFHKRYQRAEEMFNSHKDEIIKIAREKISRKGYEFSDLAGRLGLGSEDRTIALLFDTYLGILTVDDRYSEDKKVDLGLVETRAYEVARAVKQEVLSNLDVENQMEEAYRDFDRGKGWYFETREGKAALSGLKTERKESDIS